MAVKGIKKQDLFTYRVTFSEEDGEYIGLCAEFPGLSWLDETKESALHGITKVVADVISDMESSGEPVPEPISTRRYSGNFTVRIPPELHRKLAVQAAESNVSINRLISVKLAGE